MAERNSEDTGNQMSFYPMMLAESFGSSCSVEVTKGHIFDLVNPIEPAQDLFEHQF